MAKPGKKAKGPLRSVQRSVGQANVSLKSIASVLDQQQDALKQIQENSAAVQDQKSVGSTIQTTGILNEQLTQLQKVNDSLKNIQIAIVKAITKDGKPLDKVDSSLKGIQKTLNKNTPKDTSPLQKNQIDYLKKLLENSNKQIAQISAGNKDWKGFKDKFKDLKANLKESIDPDNIKKAILGPFKMFKVARDKIEDIDYMKRNKAMGFAGTKKELKEQAVESRKKKTELLRTEEQYQKMKKAGATDADIAKANPEFVKKRATLLKDYQESRIAKSKSAPLAQLPSDKGKVPQSTTDVLAEQQTNKEQASESLRISERQSLLLQTIAENTSLMAGKKGSDSGDNAGGQGLGDFAKSMKGIGSSLGGLGKGIGLAVGMTIGGVFQGIMEGVSNGIKAFANVKTVAGVVVLGLLTGVVWGLSKALENFANLEWETLGKAALVLTGLIAAGAAAGVLAGTLGLGAAALAGLGAAVWVIGGAMEMMGQGLERLVTGLERLQEIDGEKLMGVGEGLKSLGLAFAAFGAGQAAAGLGTLIGNLLTIGQDSPVEQLVKIGAAGDGIDKAGKGLTSLSSAMKEFSKVDPAAMKSAKEFPWEQATKFAAAGGAMQVSGVKVYNASKGNMDEQAKVDGKAAAKPVSAGATTNIQQNNNQTNVTKPPTRNPESSYNRYLMSRF